MYQVTMVFLEHMVGLYKYWTGTQIVMAAILLAHTINYETQVKIRNKDFWFRFFFSTISFPDKEVIYVCHLMREVTKPKIFETRNVSIGNECPHLCTCGWMDGRMDKGKSKSSPPLSGGIKIYLKFMNVAFQTKNILLYIQS